MMDSKKSGLATQTRFQHESNRVFIEVNSRSTKRSYQKKTHNRG
jgi:hypothetical protein